VWTRSLLAGPAYADVSGGREKHEALGPDLARLVARALQVRLEHLRGDAIQLQGAPDLLGQPPVVVGAFDASAVRLDLDDEDGVRGDDDRVQLVDDAATLHEPRVTVDGEAVRQPLDKEAERLPFRIVRRLTDLDELGPHRHTSRIFAVGNQIASWFSTRKSPPLSG
jgi:hypothetical protein